MSGSVSTGSVLCFDIFQLDLRAGELHKNGVKLRLQGQPLQVLGILLRSAGNVVTREELSNEIWPADTFVDFDHSLHNAIARIRETLGDSAQNPRYIETLPRRGYRFMGEVAELARDNSALEPVRETDTEPPLGTKDEGAGNFLGMNWWSDQTVFAYALAGALAVALTIPFLSSWHGAAAPSVLQSIAVLPLENLSGDSSQDCFVDGMTEQLITDLAKVRSLHVISRTSVMRYKGTKKGLPEIARELKVDAIVEGSVLRAGKRVRITAQLLHAPTDQHLWAETYERDLGDELSLQREVAQAIAQQVQAQVAPQKAVLSRNTLSYCLTTSATGVLATQLD